MNPLNAQGTKTPMTAARELACQFDICTQLAV